jgi:hypothetical protein
MLSFGYQRQHSYDENGKTIEVGCREMHWGGRKGWTEVWIDPWNLFPCMRMSVDVGFDIEQAKDIIIQVGLLLSVIINIYL